MSTEFSNSEALLLNAVDTKLYPKLVAQLEKDFGLANVPIDLKSNTPLKSVPPAVLKTTLHEKIYFLIMEKFTDYLNLLYMVDVPEKSFKSIAVTDVVEVAEQVSFMILKRELQKVWLRERYSHE
tara:strand:- start:2436 stop:2810 length:375 start_codon:yes stop_codon:yes gene_type:complete